MPAMEGLYAKYIDNSSHIWRLTKIPAPASRISLRDAVASEWGTADKLVSRQVSGETPRD
jgi:hypothetical protein